MDKTLTEKLFKLKYHHKWLEYRFIDEEFLDEQYKQYQETANKNTEHYRYCTFLKILRENQSLDEQAIARYIELAQIDTDKTMAHSALMELIRWNKISVEQLKLLQTNPVFKHSSFQTLIKRKQVLTELINIKLLDDNKFEYFLSIKDDEVHIALLSRPEISKPQIKLIQQHGANRIIINLAKNLLRTNRTKS